MIKYFITYLATKETRSNFDIFSSRPRISGFRVSYQAGILLLTRSMAEGMKTYLKYQVNFVAQHEICCCLATTFLLFDLSENQ